MEKDKWVEIEKKENISTQVYISSNYPGPIAIDATINQPERSKREDFHFDKLAEDYMEFPLNKGYQNYSEEEWFNRGVIEFAKWLNERCGALNTMET